MPTLLRNPEERGSCREINELIYDSQASSERSACREAACLRGLQRLAEFEREEVAHFGHEFICGLLGKGFVRDLVEDANADLV
jgi:hypothetical protein